MPGLNRARRFHLIKRCLADLLMLRQINLFNITEQVCCGPGNTYTLNVVFDGKTLTASSIMPKPVAPDSVLSDSLLFF